jgi:hypothetical protein
LGAKILKKILIIIFILISGAAAFFFFKNYNRKYSGIENVALNFNANSTIITPEKEYECEIHHIMQKNTVIKITSPEDIKDLTISFENDEKKINFGQLECKSGFFPETSFIGSIVKVLNNLNDSTNFTQFALENQDIKITGAAAGDKFEAICDMNGLLKEINLPEKNVSVKLSCFEII